MTFKLVSKQLSGLNLEKKVDELWEDIYQAQEDLWGKDQVDKIFGKDFEPILSSLHDAIEKGMADSIHEMFGERGNYDLI